MSHEAKKFIERIRKVASRYGKFFDAFPCLSRFGNPLHMCNNFDL